MLELLLEGLHVHACSRRTQPRMLEAYSLMLTTETTSSVNFPKTVEEIVHPPGIDYT